MPAWWPTLVLINKNENEHVIDFFKNSENIDKYLDQVGNVKGLYI